jgi:hypothetical protein
LRSAFSFSLLVRIALKSVSSNPIRRDTKVGTFTQAPYDEAKKNGWTVISMKNDWTRIFGFESVP